MLMLHRILERERERAKKLIGEQELTRLGGDNLILLIHQIMDERIGRVEKKQTELETRLIRLEDDQANKSVQRL